MSASAVHPPLDTSAWTCKWQGIAAADKALLAGSLLAAAFIVPPLVGALAVMACATTLAACAGVRIKLWLTVLTVPGLFLVPSAMPLAVHVDWSQITTGWSALTSTRPMWTHALEITLRAWAASSACLLLACTTPMADILGLLRALRVPSTIIGVALVMYRLVFVLWEQILVSYAARQARGGGQITVNSAAQTIATVGVQAWARASAMEQGIQGRGDGSQLPADRPTQPAPWMRVAAPTIVVVSIIVAYAFQA